MKKNDKITEIKKLLESFLKRGRRGVGFFLLLPAILFAVLAYVFYTQTGITDFNPKLNTGAFLFLEFALILCAVSLFTNWKATTYGGFLCSLYAFICYIASQVTYIVNIAVGIDGTPITPGFVFTMIFFVLTILCFLFAGIFANFQLPKKGK